MLIFLLLVYTLVQLVAGLGPTRRQLLSSSVIRRADDTELWNNAVSKGCILYGAMFVSDKEAGAMFKPQLSSAQSKFHGTDDVFDWGYEENDPDNQWRDFSGNRLGFAHVLRALQVSDQAEKYGGDVHCVEVTHGDLQWELDPPHEQVPLDKQTYDVDGKEYRVTGAFFRFGVNPYDGVIIAMERETPQFSGQDRNPPVSGADLPSLRQSSDIFWPYWAKFTAENSQSVHGIRYFLVSEITNAESLSIIEQALQKTKNHLGPWPGVSFEYEKQHTEFSALLGTPNSKFVSYFLIQHKSQLDNMHVSKITVFHGDTWSKNPCLLFEVGPAHA